MDIKRWRDAVRMTLAIGLAMAAATAMAGAESMAGQGATKRVCVGHFLLELPTGARVDVSGSYKGIEAERHAQTGFDVVAGTLRARADGLGASKVEQDAYAAAIYRSGGVDPDGLFGDSQLLGFDQDEARGLAVLGYHKKPGAADITVEVHRLFERGRYVFSVDNLGADKYPAVRESVLRASERFHPLEPGEVPAEPGFCVGNGMFQEDGPQDIGGDATLVARFPEYPNVTFSVDVSGIAQPSREGGLESRVDGEMGLLSRVATGARTLRRGKQRYASQDGYLVAISVDDEEGRVQKYFWGADGVPNDPRQPLVEIQLMAGESGPSPLSDEALGELWDRLLAGFRLR